uniref:Glutamate 5-kinase n=1 Tax=uncultured Chloroflexi bacterium HF0500_03M05 TaxID=710737 RepID=E0XY66_9CHLR|nr:glutamate 5-kinase [uncultured Chloroflexi bacterium HF0500_03M05]
MTSCNRIVVKAGTTLLIHGTDQLNLQVMSTMVEQIVRLHRQGIEIILVSSGAVAAGRHVLGVSKEEKTVPFRQVLAAAGQGRLMHVYEQLFDWHQVPVGQALLTRNDLSDRLGYLNVRNTLLSLLELRVIPIANENDVVAVDELAGEIFGDNDNLSAMIANLVDADLLVMLGEMEGLYTADPHLDDSAHLIPTIERMDTDIEALGGDSWGDQGRGGMATKLEAARLATNSGVNVVIASGLERDILPRLAKGERIGTFIAATGTKKESRKRWMLSGLSNGGNIVIDDGASTALLQNNGSLLPAGVKEVVGIFNRGDIVSIQDTHSTQIAAGITNYSSKELDMIKGKHSNQIDELLGHQYGDEVVHRNNMVMLQELS